MHQAGRPIDRHMKLSQQRQDTQEKVNQFMDRLKSTEESDIQINASILDEILKSFSLTFGVDSGKITSLISN